MENITAPSYTFVMLALATSLLAPTTAVMAADIPPGTAWHISQGDPATADEASCTAWPLQARSDDALDAIHARLIFTRKRTENGDVNATATLVLSTSTGKEFADRVIHFDGKPDAAAGTKVFYRVTEQLALPVLRKQLLSSPTIYFSVADKADSEPTSVFLDALDKLDACAVLKAN
ncbi:hypothetical protein [Paludibacterium sp.]|uniref:hypothetical protein n=1 Tax=Paludibacterium sp. TaxID=1917523 RepID=UPI001DA059A2|nr:hypothetical protein [Paludibacterium sp.]MBV8059900.1 hypothetical protein [Alphaproteobacteria bacterium]MBV8646014.1 hypothetical protein [Paludibacterium sp.]